MRLRYKAPSGGRTLELDDAATVSQLLEAIKQATGESEVTIKYGWPPQALSLDQPDTSLQSLGLQRESLTIIPAAKPSLDEIATPPAATGASAAGSALNSQPPKSIKDQNISVSVPENGSRLGISEGPSLPSLTFHAQSSDTRYFSPPSHARRQQLSLHCG